MAYNDLPDYNLDPPNYNTVEVEDYIDYIRLHLVDYIDVSSHGTAYPIGAAGNHSYTDNDFYEPDQAIISEVYDRFILKDLDSAIEDVYSIADIDFTEPGFYEVRADATLAYRVSGIWYNLDAINEWDEEPDYVFDNAEITFLPEESFVENIKVTQIS